MADKVKNTIPTKTRPVTVRQKANFFNHAISTVKNLTKSVQPQSTAAALDKPVSHCQSVVFCYVISQPVAIK